MVLKHIWGLFVNPKREWVSIRDDECTLGKCYAVHVMILAAIPAISGFIGTTQFGWQIGAGDPVKLTLESAGMISILYYLAMLVGVFAIGWMIHWMGGTYGVDVPLSQCVVLAAYTATPLFLIGIMELYPVLWVNLVVGIVAIAIWSVIADLLDFGGGWLWFFVMMFAIFGALVKYVAWTVGFGAAVLTRFGTAEGWGGQAAPPAPIPPALA